MDHAEKLRERHRQRVRGRYKLLAADQVKCRALVKELYQQRRTFLALHAQSGESMSNALQRYIDAIALSDRLRKEKHLLLQLMHEREFTQDRVVHIVSECGDFASTNEIVRSCPTMNFQPLTVAECRELTGAYYRRIQQSMLTQSSRTTRSVMGWSDGTLVDGSVISISMQKDLVGHTPLELSSRSWDLCLDAGSNDLYSSEFTSTAECLQVVDQDNLVIYERIARGGPDDVAHSIFLVSRIKIDDGYMEITQPLDRSRLALSPAESTGKWIDSDLWIMYQACQGDDFAVRVTSGGVYEVDAPEEVEFWAMELQHTAIRWENAVVGPRFSLTNG